MGVSVSIVLDTRRIKQKTGKYPVQLQIINNRKPKRYPTIFEMTKEDYEKLNAPRVSALLHEVRDRLKSLKTDAELYVSINRDFNPARFEVEFVNNHLSLKSRKVYQQAEEFKSTEFDYTPYLSTFPILNETNLEQGTILPVYISYIKKLIEEERIGSAIGYQESYNALKKFRGNVRFVDITPTYLTAFEKSTLNSGLSKATLGIRLRPLRAIFNEAIDVHKIISREYHYPFGRRKYIIPTGRNIKKALNEDDLHKLYNYKPVSALEQQALDYWFFCYFSNGMNPKDVACLKYRDIHDGFLSFFRAKTENTRREDPKPIIVCINDDIARTIERYGNKDKHPNNYIFPILNADFNPVQKHNAVKAFLRFINDSMRPIAKQLGIDKKVTTIVSRHTMATNLKRAGASTEFIQETLGHANKTTTENYLASFTIETKRQYAETLEGFKRR